MLSDPLTLIQRWRVQFCIMLSDPCAAHGSRNLLQQQLHSMSVSTVAINDSRDCWASFRVNERKHVVGRCTSALNVPCVLPGALACCCVLDGATASALEMNTVHNNKAHSCLYVTDI
jgi:hypothetical protein